MYVKRIVRSLFNIITWAWFLIHGTFSAHAFVFSQNVRDRVYVIEAPLVYKVLNPVAGDSLGFTLPFVGVAYINKQAVQDADTPLPGVISHEAKHIEQFWQLGIHHFGIEKWKLEGMAEYVRGDSTISLCASGVEGLHDRIKYRDYHIAVKYLIEVEGLSEDQIYNYSDYPLGVASDWINAEICKKA
ncbi:hypothetical protein [Microbulbifer sp. THAF38]|uniref:hypothetical protein n=1 Tax=Microbulbifer sp. THAF38 TaxID=2587856 RepID=UPI001267B5D8|nr:hypothetical protein [Microbulbifer sp. THAF38]QFT53772.1 hypothetical protein FIU95_04185 [Microbulbifer sp. THAF38]